MTTRPVESKREIRPVANDAIEIDVVGGLAKATFKPGCATGRDDDTRPGVGFDVVATHVSGPRSDGTFHVGCGVIGRHDAARLRDMLEIFLKSHTRGEEVA